LEDLAASERTMYALDHAKDQTMTLLKLALAHLVMWTRDRYFPASYAQAAWHRLALFFRLPGRIVWGTDTVTVELRPFNDRRLTHESFGAVSARGGRPASVAWWPGIGAMGGLFLSSRFSCAAG
jgi:hypothetical protein